MRPRRIAHARDSVVPLGGGQRPVQVEEQLDVLLADGALLRSSSGEGWRFRAAGASIGLEESVYLGRTSEMRRAEQIVLTGTTAADGATIKWAFGRIEAERIAPAAQGEHSVAIHGRRARGAAGAGAAAGTYSMTIFVLSVDQINS